MSLLYARPRTEAEAVAIATGIARAITVIVRAMFMADALRSRVERRQLIDANLFGHLAPLLTPEERVRLAETRSMYYENLRNQ